MTDKSIYDICISVASNSKCLSRKIGAVLVKDGCVVSTGYNGPPRGVHHCDVRHQYDDNLRKEYKKRGILKEEDFKVTHVLQLQRYAQTVYGYNHISFNKCPRQLMGFKSGEGLQWCIAGHAERNALNNAGRLGISTYGTTMYMSCGIPCSPCLVEIINHGVKEIVVTKMSYYDISAEYLVKDSDLKIRVYDFIDPNDPDEKY